MNYSNFLPLLLKTKILLNALLQIQFLQNFLHHYNLNP